MFIKTKTDKGLYRQKNEDFLCVAHHPKDENIILLAIADGMGGKELGEVASQLVVTYILEYFNNTSLSLYNNIDILKKELDILVHKINDILIDRYKGKTGTTLCLSIITNNKTIILNSGDSRCYIYKENSLIQITQDDSEVFRLFKTGKVLKDDLKYFTYNNLISSCIGLSKELCNTTFYELDNNYDMLFLFTDGVTDILNDKDIKDIIVSSPKEDILENIIDSAVYEEHNLEIPEYLKAISKNLYIPPNGKDNTSGIIYIKEKE